MRELPSGTVTFLFTDLEGSTRLWQDDPAAMQPALARHDEIIRGSIDERGGSVVKMTGDGAHAAFATAHAAVHAAVDAQLALQREPWPETASLRVRMGLHTGSAEVRDGDYFGTEVNRAARLMAVAHGGQILCSQSTADLARSALGASCTLVDLGEQQLRDLQTPERVFQVVHPDLPIGFPVLRTLDAFPGNLPLQVTEFVGRDDELVELSKLLGRFRVVTLTGTGGVGKTRLAVQAAAEATPHYPDGTWFIDLAAVDDDTLVAATIATTMGLPEHRQGTRDEALVGALRRRRAMLVLDNCEHLVDTVAGVVDLVVRGCPGVTVLSTSQEGLGVDGELTIPVRPLREGEAERLFVERAEAARHGFELNADNSAAIVELCRRLDGIPLAIELAAARVASMSPAAILERIDERFRLLGQGRRTARRRHQTLRAAVDWSYGLLSTEEQLVFERLAVFAGSFTLDAAEAIVADDVVDVLDVLDLASSLVAKSMVQLDERTAGDRYRLLETMRDYGLERLAERGDLDRMERRHAAHYLELAERAALAFVSADEREWFDRVDGEQANLRAALAFLRDSGDGESYLRLAAALGRFWHTVGLFREGLAWLTSALAVGPAVPSRRRAETLALAANMAILLDRYEEAFALLDDSIACSTDAGEAPRPRALLGLGLAALVQNRTEDAVRYSEEAIAVARGDGDPYELAETLNLASAPVSFGSDDGHAAELADEAVTIAQGLGNDHLLAAAQQAAAIARCRIDPGGAIALFTQSFAVLDHGYHLGGGVGHTWKAVAHTMLREYPAAAAELCTALPLLQESGEPYQQSIALAVAASVLSRPRPDTAVRLLAFIERQRDDGRFLGASGDLAVQTHVRGRLEGRLDPTHFAELWAQGRAMTLDAASADALDQLARITDAQ